MPRSYIFIALSLLLCFREVCSQTWSEAQVAGNGSLDVYWYESKPFIYNDEGKGMSGLEVEMMQTFAAWLNEKYDVQLSLRWKESSSFYGIIEQLSKSPRPNEMGVSAFSITEERKRLVQYSDSYLPDITVLVSSEGTPIVENLEDIDDLMKDMEAITIKGTVYESMLMDLKEKLHIDFKIRYISSDDNVLDHISRSPHSFGFIDLPIYLMWIKSGSELVRQNFFTVMGTGYGFLMPRESDWSVPMNEFLRDPQNKAQIADIISRHMSPDLYSFIEDLYHEDKLGTTILTKEKEIQLMLLRNANLKIEQEKMYQHMLMLVVLITTLLMVIIGVAFYKIKVNHETLKAQKEQIEAQQADIRIKNDQLINRNARLMALNEEKNYLVNILAHDLRSPMSRIIGFTSIIQSGKVVSEQELRDYLANIHDAANRMNRMVAKMLNKDVLEGELKYVSKEPVSVNQVVGDINMRYQPIAEKKGISFQMLPCAESATIRSDYMLLLLVLENLVSNAIKFSRAGTAVRLETICGAKEVTFKVIDQGPGFTDEDKIRMYTRLQPLSATPTSGEPSTGLGLSIVKKYVTELGGEIHLKSVVGQGSTFIVTLPVS